MKGVVEVYRVYDDGSSELVCSEENLIMDGASESIVDFLTMPSSVAIVEGELKEKVLDTSNYIIQGFTTAKGKKGYLHNAHKYKKHNLIVSGSNWDDTSYYENPNCRIQKANAYSPFDMSSEIFRLSTINPSTASSVLLFNEFSDHLDYAVNTPLIWSVDLKHDFQLPPETVSNPPTAGRSISTLLIKRHGVTTSGTVQWISSLSKVVCAPLEGNVLVKELGTGWYRVAVVSPSGTVADGITEVAVFPTGEGTERTFVNTSPSGGMLMSRPSLNFGSLPINYYLGSETLFDAQKDSEEFPILTSSLPCIQTHGLAGTVPGSVSAFVMPNDVGTLRSNVSAYDPIMSLPLVQDPKYTGIEPGSVTDYATCLDVDIQEDHNLNFALVYAKDYNMYQHLSKGWSAGSDLTALPAMADVRWFGGYGFDEKVLFSLTSGVDVLSYNNLVHTKERAAAGVNNVSEKSCDPLGYIRARYAELGEDVTGASSPYYLKCQTSDPYAGSVDYKISLTDYDVATLNIFGGTMIMGMYSLDYREMLKNGLSLDNSVDKLVLTGDDMKFRLFSRKVFNENLNAASDVPALGANGAGNSLHSSLVINWRLNFL